MKKLVLYKQEDIFDKKDEIIGQNAFIKRDGTFFLAKGATGNNPSFQLDSSALAIGRQDIGKDFMSRYYEGFESRMPRMIFYSNEEIFELAKIDGTSPEFVDYKITERIRYIRQQRRHALNRKRSILVQYYGYAMFARIEKYVYDALLGGERIKSNFDKSIFPNPEWYGIRQTEAQEETMLRLYRLNNEEGWKKPEDCIKLMLTHYSDDDWNC